MNKAVALAATTLLAACGNSVDLCEDAEARMLAAAEETRRLMRDGDLAAVVKQIPEELVPGGPAALNAALAKAEGSKRMAMAMAETMEFEAPRPIHRVGHRHVCVIPYECSFNGQPMRACFIAVSSDGGRNWAFISGSSGGVAGLRTTAPELVEAIEHEIQVVEVNGRAR